MAASSTSGQSGVLGVSNPTGVNMPGGVVAPATGSGGSTGNNPYFPTGAPVGAAGAGTTGMPNVPFTANGSGTGINFAGLNPASGLDPGYKSELQNTYGNGLGNTLYNFLSGGAGYNPAVAQALIAQMQPGEERAQENLMEQFGAGGDRFGSAAAIGLGDLENQEQLGENSILANEYNQGVQNYMSTINDTKDAVAQNQSSGIWGWLNAALNIGGDIGGAFIGDPALGQQISGIAGGLESAGGVNNAPGGSGGYGSLPAAINAFQNIGGPINSLPSQPYNLSILPGYPGGYVNFQSHGTTPKGAMNNVPYNPTMPYDFGSFLGG